MNARNGLFLLVFGLASGHAAADGKFFAFEGLPVTTATPSQRSVIGFDGTTQTMAIDTAFSAHGHQVAWLVPLPSVPEITATTQGLFQSAAAITGPRISQSDGVVPGAHFACVLAIAGLFWWMVSVTRAPQTLKWVIAMLPIPLVAALLIPAIGESRSMPTVLEPVTVHARGTAGIYDTAVLEARSAADLLSWLQGSGFAAPASAEPVIQDYLDRGWVFAAARVRSEVDAASAERRAQPLQFRFATPHPVYPMALTGIDNGPIALELIVFANGTAQAPGLSVDCSVRTVMDAPMSDWGHVSSRNSDGRAIVAHPGLIEMSLGQPIITRLSGVLGPEQQATDLSLRIDPFESRDPLYLTQEARLGRAYSCASFAAAMVVLPAGVFGLLSKAESQGRRSRFVALAVPVTALAAGAAFALTPAWPGEVVKTYPAAFRARSMMECGLILSYAQNLSGADLVAEARQRFEAEHMDAGWTRSGTRQVEGDGPLMHRFETAPDASAWYIYHDAAGGEHRFALGTGTPGTPMPNP